MRKFSMTNLDSTSIQSVAVTKPGSLDIMFKSNPNVFYRFFFVSDKEIAGLVKAESRGKYLRAKIIGHKTCVKFEMEKKGAK